MRVFKVFIIVFAAFAAGTLFTGCNKDKPDKPQITVKMVEREGENYVPNQKELVRFGINEEYEFKPLFSKAFEAAGYTVAVEFDFKAAGGIKSIEVEGAHVIDTAGKAAPFLVADKKMFDSGTRHIETFLVKPPNDVMEDISFTISITDRENQNTKADVKIYFSAPYYFANSARCKNTDIRAWYYSLKHNVRFEETDIVGDDDPDKLQREDIDFAFAYSNAAGGAVVYSYGENGARFKRLIGLDENKPDDWWNNTTPDTISTRKLNKGDMYYFQREIGANALHRGALIVEGETIENNEREITIRVISRKETFEALLEALKATNNDEEEEEPEE